MYPITPFPYIIGTTTRDFMPCGSKISFSAIASIGRSFMDRDN